MLIEVPDDLPRAKIESAFAAIGLLVKPGDSVPFVVSDRTDAPRCRICARLATIYDSKGLLCSSCARELYRP